MSNLAASPRSTWRPLASPWQDGTSPLVLVVLLMVMLAGLGTLLAVSLFQ